MLLTFFIILQKTIMIKLIMIVEKLTWAFVKMILMIDINFINIITTSMMMLVCPHIRQMTAVSLGTDIRHLSLPLSTPHSGPLPLSLSSLSSFIIKFFPHLKQSSPKMERYSSDLSF